MILYKDSQRRIEVRRLVSTDADLLASLFAEIESSGDALFFHPHDFTPEEARRICSYQGVDLYCTLWIDDQIAGYGILRGWDAGYKIPSLGIWIAANFRTQGLGYLLMEVLHAAARSKGAKKVRLKVYPGNQPAVRLYRKLGYEFSDVEDGQLVGYITL